MRKAAEKQVEESQQLAVAAQEQLEDQQRPALTLGSIPGHGFLVVSNIGKGPALDVTFNFTEAGRSLDLPIAPISDSNISFVMAGQGVETTFGLENLEHGERYFSVACRYRSLSDTIYYTVVDFNEQGPTATRFATEGQYRLHLRS
jgi:hypothetical protein